MGSPDDTDGPHCKLLGRPFHVTIHHGRLVTVFCSWHVLYPVKLIESLRWRISCLNTSWSCRYSTRLLVSFLCSLYAVRVGYGGLRVGVVVLTMVGMGTRLPGFPAIGSLPLWSDAKLLAEGYQVGAVINLCIEYPGGVGWRAWLGGLPGALVCLPPSLPPSGLHSTRYLCFTYFWAGPLDAYKAVGIEQLWLPTVDTAAPTLDQVEKVSTSVGEGVVMALVVIMVSVSVFARFRGWRSWKHL